MIRKENSGSGNGDSNLSLKYEVLLSQTGTAAPTAIVLKASDITLAWSRVSAGVYRLTSTAKFVENKTIPVDDIMMDQNGNIYTLNWISANVIELKTYAADNTGQPVDDILNKRYILIQVYK